MTTQLIKEFRNRYNKQPDHVFFCPGRVNLIGEHIDYNGGNVMPCAISLGTYVAVSKNTDKLFRFQSLDFPEIAELHLQTSYTRTGKEWFNYPLGVINEVMADGANLAGLDMLFTGNLPIGSGLSSSASIEVLMAYTLDQLFLLNIPKKELAILSKKVENEFIGVNCGIMDQFAVAMGKENNAILLNCDTIEYSYLPMELGEYVLAIINTNKPRKLAESKYNERFLECGKALTALKKEIEMQALCDISLSVFENNKHLIEDTTIAKRALHVISENERVSKATHALRSGDLEGFGQLMYESHESLQHLYEVSGIELDTIVEGCRSIEGCIGARMTGAGFGGCAIALVKKTAFDNFSTAITRYYSDKIGYPPGVFASLAGEGVRTLS